MTSEMNQLNLLRNSSMNLLIDTQVKRYNIVVRGKVHDVGFRDYLIADIKTNTINIKNGIDDLKTNTINIERGIDHLKINTIDIKNGVYSLNSKFDLFFEEQKGFNKNIIEHNFRLEKILEKLSEK